MKPHEPRTDRQYAGAGFRTYDSNDLDTVIRRGEGEAARYFIVPGSARETMHRETQRVGRRLTLSILGRCLFSLAVTATVVFAIIPPGKWPGLVSALSEGYSTSLLAVFPFVFAAAVLAAALLVGVFAITTPWSRRWQPSFGGFDADHLTGLTLFLGLTPDDRDRLMRAREVSPTVLERAIDLIWTRYREAEIQNLEAERERERREAQRIIDDRD